MQVHLHRQGTGVHVKCPELTQCLKALDEGDTLTVWKFDRLGRSLRDLMGLSGILRAASGRGWLAAMLITLLR